MRDADNQIHASSETTTFREAIEVIEHCQTKYKMLSTLLTIKEACTLKQADK